MESQGGAGRLAFGDLLEKVEGEGQQLVRYAVSTPQLIEIILLCRIN